eukprot:3344112-Pleurochrysis_carterae.AAC.1
MGCVGRSREKVERMDMDSLKQSRSAAETASHSQLSYTSQQHSGQHIVLCVVRILPRLDGDIGIALGIVHVREQMSQCLALRAAQLEVDHEVQLSHRASDKLWRMENMLLFERGPTRKPTLSASSRLAEGTEARVGCSKQAAPQQGGRATEEEGDGGVNGVQKSANQLLSTSRRFTWRPCRL